MKKVALVLSLVGVTLTGCTTSGAVSGSAPSTTSAASQATTVPGAPTFTGPYAAVLADAYAKSRSTFERDALADGKITDAEQAEMVERLRTCVSGFGHTLVSYGKAGGSTFDLNPNQESGAANDEISTCEKSAGENTVGLVYSLVLRNPQNIDLVPKTIACLKKHQLVGPGYSRSDYERGLPNFPDEKRNAQVLQCNDDPLNRIKGK